MRCSPQNVESGRLRQQIPVDSCLTFQQYLTYTSAHQLWHFLSETQAPSPAHKADFQGNRQRYDSLISLRDPLRERSDDANFCVSQAWYSTKRAPRKRRLNWLLFLGAHLRCAVIRRGTSREQGLSIKKMPQI